MSDEPRLDDEEPAETLLTFPCRFPIKTMGRVDSGILDTVVAIVEKHAGKVPDDDVRETPSSKGTFVSVTITIDASSQQQLDDIYRELSAHDDVLISL